MLYHYPLYSFITLSLLHFYSQNLQIALFFLSYRNLQPRSYATLSLIWFYLMLQPPHLLGAPCIGELKVTIA